MVKNQQQEQQSIGTKLLHNDYFAILSTTKKLVRNKSGQTLGILTTCQDLTYNPFFNQHLLFSQKHLKRCASINGMQVHYIIEDYDDNKNNLSKRQGECLFLLCHGLSAKAIGAVLNLSKRTVESYINDLKNKLNCHSKSDLISHCMTLGIQNIIPSDILFNKLLNKQFADELY